MHRFGEAQILSDADAAMFIALHHRRSEELAAPQFYDGDNDFRGYSTEEAITGMWASAALEVSDELLSAARSVNAHDPADRTFVRERYAEIAAERAQEERRSAAEFTASCRHNLDPVTVEDLALEVIERSKQAVGEYAHAMNVALEATTTRNLGTEQNGWDDHLHSATRNVRDCEITLDYCRSACGPIGGRVIDEWTYHRINGWPPEITERPAYQRNGRFHLTQFVADRIQHHAREHASDEEGTALRAISPPGRTTQRCPAQGTDPQATTAGTWTARPHAGLTPGSVRWARAHLTSAD